FEHGIGGRDRRRSREVALNEGTPFGAFVDDVADLAAGKGREIAKEVRSPVAATQLREDERSRTIAAGQTCHGAGADRKPRARRSGAQLADLTGVPPRRSVP